MIYDYEHATALGMLHPTYVVVPDIIADEAIRFHKSHVRKYPGIKEDVYVPDFKPDPQLRQRLGLDDDEIAVTIRPPASEAHYRSPDSEKLFKATVAHLAGQNNVRMVMLPRNERQASHIRNQWPDLVSARKIIIPSEVIDGLNVIWCSDLVISGGGTMNREAAALGVPVYSIFRGKTGAVDQYLAKQGRLTLLETEEDVRTKIRVERRDAHAHVIDPDRAAMRSIVSTIEEALGREREKVAI
jgi:predicted glycosyltransferase